MVRWNRIVGLILIVAVLTVTMIFTTNQVLQNITLGLDLRGGFEVLYQASATDGQEISKQSLKDTATALEKRINFLGVSEPEITIEGIDRIRVKLAGVPDQDSARDLLGKPAKLTFRNMNNEILLDGNDLVPGGASVDVDQLGRPTVTLKLQDANKFKQITTEYVGESIAILLDEEVIQSPRVNEPISGGNAVISGQESVEKAQGLADLLNAGALPLDLKEIQSQSVGESLGMNALELSVKAGLIGSALVLLFMMLYYRIPGLIASFSLVVYIYLVLVIFWQLHVTLTLPGIAALVLGIGMAVDANIITYERIKEEIKSGKSYLSAVRAGSRRSLSTILDANITTILAAIVLFIFGTGSIQGFAITLIVSIIVSMFTAVFGARLLLNLFVRSDVLNKAWVYGVKEEEISAL